MTDRQPRVTDLIPQRYGIVLLVWLAGLAAVAGLEALYLWMPDLAALAGDGQLPAADLQSEGSLASWFSSTILLLAAVVSIVVYSVRRHRKDDYHGHYRIWLWSALVWLTMSVDEGSSLHEAFRELVAYAAGTRGWGDGSIWWIAGYGLVFAVVGGRLLLEMRVCRLSTAVMLFAAGCYAVAVAVKLEWLLTADGIKAVMVKEGCEMSGNLCLLMAMILHARFVILEAEGRLPARRVKAARPEKKSEKPKVEAAPAAADAGPAKRSWFRKVKVDAAHPGTPAPAAKPREASKSVTVTARPGGRGRSEEEYDYELDGHRQAGRNSRPSAADDDDGYGDDDAAERRLSKAQRKALRRQKERQRRGDE